MKKFNLYLDESGDFNDTNPNRPFPEDLSLVGGMLVDPDIVSEYEIRNLFPQRVHCSERGFKDIYLARMEELKKKSQRIIIFENSERIKIVSPDRTYINIMSEGLLKLFQDLSFEFPEGVFIKVVIAQRNAALKEYALRMEEQLILGFGKKDIKGCQYELELSDAKTDRRLYIADILCYTYFTLHRAINKFNPDQQRRAKALFDQAQIYSVFEDATVSYIKKLVLDNHLGEAICQICALPHLKTLIHQRDTILRHLPKMHPLERKHILEQISILLTGFEHQQKFAEGIALANHFEQYFLSPMMNIDEIKSEASYWQFDTDFHLLTLYDHLGNTRKCDIYLKECRKNIAVLTNSWEQLDYYFSFRIRELNTLMNQFRFEEVVQKSDEFIQMFQATRDHFNSLFSKTENAMSIKSELLGKTLGIRLQALTNLVSRKPELFGEALATSDKAIAEFTNTSDKIRQLNYRSTLMVAANKPDEALDCLYQIAGLLDGKEAHLDSILQAAYRNPENPDLYLLLCFSDVAILLLEANHPQAQSVCHLLFKNPLFEHDYTTSQKTDYPMNRILWNVAKYYSLGQINSLADIYYEKAMNRSKANKECATVVSYCAAISAERFLVSQNRSKQIRKSCRKQWSEANKLLRANTVPASIKAWFDVDHPAIDFQAKSAWK